MEHEITRNFDGKNEMQSITPICSCGWVGTPEYAYNDYQYSRIKDQEGRHRREAKQAKGE